MNKFPRFRKLKVMAFDPSLMASADSINFNKLTVEVRWERNLDPGPIGEYLEVIDFDPPSGVFYEPVDLNEPAILAEGGLSPSESSPHFHQQMVYAVAMSTIQIFEQALGRTVLWSDHRKRNEQGRYQTEFVRRLRIYPHALREQNAYYSPVKKALLFGYFETDQVDGEIAPGTLVFTCLSHDIVAHEMTHAILDGVHPRFNESTNPDVLAFHEGFSDLVALFMHFSHSDVLEAQIHSTRGNLETENLLGQLAQQFGKATGRGSALRHAFGKVNEQGVWEPREPNPHDIRRTWQPHQRGAILVAAVFRSFLKIYRRQTADLLRIATQGTGVLPDGDIHPDLAKRLAREAAKYARRVLLICIRAIDYCPPVNITFGDFLRGIITADIDVAPEDEAGFRVTFAQCFREWGIVPSGVTGMASEALVWPSGDQALLELDVRGKEKEQLDIQVEEFKAGLKKICEKSLKNWNLDTDRFQSWKTNNSCKYLTHGQFQTHADEGAKIYAKVFGLILRDEEAPRTVFRRSKGNIPTLEVHSVRPKTQVSLDGQSQVDIVIELTQRRRGFFDLQQQALMDDPTNPAPLDREAPCDFIYRAGCTILIDAKSQEIRRIIRTRGDISNDGELDRVRSFLLRGAGASENAFDAGDPDSEASDGGFGVTSDEPFAFLHKSTIEENHV